MSTVEASGGGESVEDEHSSEYESDPEELKLALKMRRREASDDEQDDDDDDGEGGIGRGVVVDSGGESDGQGAPGAYDDENDIDEDEEEEEEYYDEYLEEVEVIGVVVGETGEIRRETGENDGETVVEKAVEDREGDKGEGEGEGEEGEKKAVEPFAVPTSGAFYMHDDRFRGNAGRGGRNRRTFGGRKLWESKDERKWGHDKFDELNHKERHYDEGRRPSRGSYRGRGKPRGAGSGYNRGSKEKGYSGNSTQNAQNTPPKDVRGRGPKRYQPVVKNKGDTHSPQYKQSVRSFDKSSHTSSGRRAESTGSSTVEHDVLSAKKVGSNLSVASPPFYPSGASTKDITVTQKKEMHTGTHNRNMRPSANPSLSMATSNPVLKGKNVIDSTAIDNLHIDNAVAPTSTKAVNNLYMQSSTSSSLSPNQFSHPRGQGRVVSSSRPSVYQPIQTNNQVNKVSPQATQSNQRSPVVSQGQSSLQGPGQQLTQGSIVASQSLSPPKSGKGAVQGTGRGSLVYGGAQVIGSGGNVSSGHGDPNMPAFFPVMQFGGQRPGGMGVPAVGMAFPGYVAQPNGLGNSEMTWLPMLASAAGAMGATYCPPYLAVDGNYHSRSSGQTSALPAPGQDNNLIKPNDEIKPQQKSEVASDELGQRQNKPRRYSEMSFSQ